MPRSKRRRPRPQPGQVRARLGHYHSARVGRLAITRQPSRVRFKQIIVEPIKLQPPGTVDDADRQAQQPSLVAIAPVVLRAFVALLHTFTAHAAIEAVVRIMLILSVALAVTYGTRQLDEARAPVYVTGPCTACERYPSA